MLLYIFEVGILGVITYMICNILPFYGFQAIVVKLVICCLVPNILFVLINHRNPSYKKGLEMLKKAFRLLTSDTAARG